MSAKNQQKNYKLKQNWYSKNGRNNQGSKKGQSSKMSKKAAKTSKAAKKPPVRVSFLGGLNEIGKNITLIECEGDILIVDCGMAFPDGDMLGVDLVIPDFTYIEQNVDRVRGIVLTHGHEDHIGGLPFLLAKVNVPLYGTPLTLGLVENKLREHSLINKVKMNVVNAGSTITLGCMEVKFIHVNHSIPDAVAFAIKTPGGTLVHTGDFKIDCTPISGDTIDLSSFAKVGDEGVLALLGESTNANRPGYTRTEQMVSDSLDNLFKKAEKYRIIIATFASNVNRVQQIIDCAEKYGRKVAFSGRSMVTYMDVASKLGYLNVPKNTLIDIDMLKKYPPEQIVLITTGSQGEPISALARMAMGDHKKVSVGENDFVIISATPIPGNEKTVANTINELMKLGAEVIYEKSLGIHVSGHAAQEELKLMMNIVRPRFFIPVHGEQKHMRKHADLAKNVGIPEKNIHVPELGEMVSVSADAINTVSYVTAGRVYVDSSGVGDVGSAVLRDRKKLSTDGIVMVTAVSDVYTGGLMNPVDIQTKGFVFTDNANELNTYISGVCEDVFDRYMRGVEMDTNALKQRLKDAVAKAIFEKTRRTPIVIVSVFAV